MFQKNFINLTINALEIKNYFINLINLYITQNITQMFCGFIALTLWTQSPRLKIDAREQ